MITAMRKMQTWRNRTWKQILAVFMSADQAEFDAGGALWEKVDATCHKCMDWVDVSKALRRSRGFPELLDGRYQDGSLYDTMFTAAAQQGAYSLARKLLWELGITDISPKDLEGSLAENDQLDESLRRTFEDILKDARTHAKILRGEE